MKRKTILKTSLYSGLILLAIGLQLRAVEAFVLSRGTTAVLARWSGPPPDSPRGAIRAAAVETFGPRKVVRPPAWLGWACLSAGGVLLAYRALQSRRR